jgi:hypothetical protein
MCDTFHSKFHAPSYQLWHLSSQWKIIYCVSRTFSFNKINFSLMSVLFRLHKLYNSRLPELSLCQQIMGISSDATLITNTKEIDLWTSKDQKACSDWFSHWSSIRIVKVRLWLNWSRSFVLNQVIKTCAESGTASRWNHSNQNHGNPKALFRNQCRKEWAYKRYPSCRSVFS